MELAQGKDTAKKGTAGTGLEVRTVEGVQGGGGGTGEQQGRVGAQAAELEDKASSRQEEEELWASSQHAGAT